MHSTTFFGLLKQMEQFYAQIDTIDQLTYVVDPEIVTTKHNHRVIKLGKCRKHSGSVANTNSDNFPPHSRKSCVHENQSGSTGSSIHIDYILWTNKECWTISANLSRKNRRLEPNRWHLSEFLTNLRYVQLVGFFVLYRIYWHIFCNTYFVCFSSFIHWNRFDRISSEGFI